MAVGEVDGAVSTGATTRVRTRASPSDGRAAGHTASRESDAAAARSGARRRVPLGEQGRGLDASEQLQLASDVLQPACAIDPSNDKNVYVAGLPVAKSLDGGKTFATLDEAGGNGDPGHVDQHAIWIDPKNPKHIMIGNDGGLDISWDQGKTWDFVNTMATALAYCVTADMRHPYYVYIGLQDNGSWGGPSATRSRDGILNSDWFGIGGGDGFQTAVDPTDYNIVYTESQDGNTNRYDLRSRPRARASVRRAAAGGRGGRGGGGAGGGGAAARGRIAGRSREAAPPAGAARRWAAGAAVGRRTCSTPRRAITYRFNWNTPFMLSPHNPSIVWLGGNRLFKSYNRGDTWMASADLTKQIDRNTVALMGVAGRPHAALEERRRRVLQHDHRGLGIAGDARRRVGGHRRWQLQVSRDGGDDVHRSRQEPAGSAGRTTCTGSRASTRRISTPAPRTCRSTAIAATTSSRTSSSRAISARRGRASPATCRRSATCRWFARIRRTRTCSTSAPSSACSCRSTAARAGRSS